MPLSDRQILPAGGSLRMAHLIVGFSVNLRIGLLLHQLRKTASMASICYSHRSLIPGIDGAYGPQEFRPEFFPNRDHGVEAVHFRHLQVHQGDVRMVLAKTAESLPVDLRIVPPSSCPVGWPGPWRVLREQSLCRHQLAMAGARLTAGDSKPPNSFPESRCGDAAHGPRSSTRAH